MKLPVVKIEADNGLGFMTINESDFNPSVHKLFAVAIKEEKPAIEAKEETSDTQDLLSERPRRGRPPKEKNGTELEESL